ncbi:hypothetical protein BDN70DRAFT_849017 [Pholiota conissans]|uniref:Uncharacterized protein n=1 Tax=Pholiota conissans TaxID=109636 RepID=A0A9P5ZAQ5_9AGAR|nr:hypothetical protein BDN70DRAFT_849017 [Pholiota conissans]
MRSTISNHVESIRTVATQIWPAAHRSFRPMLNVALLANLVSDALANVQDAITPGMKRKAEDSSDDLYNNKRARTAEVCGAVHAELEAVRKSSTYPRVEVQNNSSMSKPGLIHILRHRIEVEYTDTEMDAVVEDAGPALAKFWKREDDVLRAYLLALSESLTSTKEIELGEISLGEYEDRLVGSSVKDHTWLLLLPQLTIDAETNDLSASPSDLLRACLVLRNARQAYFKASLRLVMQPQEPTSSSFPTFSLHVDFDIAIDLEAVLNNVSPNRLKATLTAIEDSRRRLFRAAFLPEPIASDEVNDAITVSAFYSILRPAPALPSPSIGLAIQPEGLLPALLPFQRRSVAWLLEREGMTLTPEGAIVPLTPKEYTFWNKMEEGDHTLYLHRLSGDLDVEEPYIPTIYGGMLAEEPGLGKTVETIALILLNPAPPSWNPTLLREDSQGNATLNAVKSTIIVTPPALASQWKEELAVHAPTLKVLIYEGWNKVKLPLFSAEREDRRVNDLIKTDQNAKKRRERQLARERANQAYGGMNGASAATAGDDAPDLTRGPDGKFLPWCDYVHQYDVVITTYNVLRTEIHAARNGREGHNPYRIRSPLVTVEWKRVVMDEVQMGGGGTTAEMVSLIPRLSSLAVSGTPAKSQVADLIHVLKFLRIDQHIGNLRMCKRLLKPGFSEDFAAFLQHYGIRTTKSSVASELTIPEQTRYLVGIDMGKVERHVYDQALERMLFDLGLDARGVAANTGWQVDGIMLRSALRNLRGICTHPQVGQLQGKNDGYKPNALKTMDAVLQVMQDQNWKTLVDDWISKIELLIRQAQLEQKDDTINNNYHCALKTLQTAGTETDKYIEEVKAALAKHAEKTKEMIAATRLRSDRPNDADPKGKGKAVSDAEDDSDAESTKEDDEDDNEEKGIPNTLAGKEHKNKGRQLRDRLRKGYILRHRVHFLLGDVWHVLGNSSEEDSAYQNAERVRHEILRQAETQATNSINRLADTASTHNLIKSELLVNPPLIEKETIKSSFLVNEVNEMVENVLNQQAELLWQWRTHIMRLLTQPLDPAANHTEADGQEFQRTLDDQGEVEIYFQCYIALLSDRREALINERTLLAAHTLKEKHARQTKAAMKAASAAVDLPEIFETPEGLEIEPKHEVIHSDLTRLRKDLLVNLNQRAVKSILVDLNNIYISISEPKHPEKILIKEIIDKIRSFTSQQTSLHDRLEIDLNLLRKSFNQRIRYFWQLQEISDSVADVEFEEDTVAAAINVCVTGKAELDAKMNTTRARFRYLDNLLKNKDNDSLEDEKECVLCRCEFVRGYITDCGHVFCEVCMKAWLYKKANKTCPVCRIAIDPTSIQRFTINAPEVEPPAKLQVSGEPIPKSHRTITYNRIDPALFDDIQSVETYGDFGSKIQTLVRHLVHLKVADPGAKSIVFSAWADSLNIVEHALRENGVMSLRIGSGSRPANTIHKFRTDPDILVLLLHGETENAGLNVTCACRVFLLESVVHHSFEIQAIARIDRLGQTRPTEVYCYYAEETVERNILDLAARKGLSLYTKENSRGTVSVSPFSEETDATVEDPAKKSKNQKGDFIYRVNDMLAILFPHMFEEVEFLLPSTALALSSRGALNGDVEMMDVIQRIPGDRDTNARAGPSRLRLDDL